MWPFRNSCRSKARLVGKTIVITGANTGIGKETARDFYRRGARVILACRDTNKAKVAIEDLKENPPKENQGKQFEGESGKLIVCQLNLCSLASVKECAKTILSTESSLHILVNNAGVMMCPYDKTEDDYEMQLQSNHLGHFLLTLLLLPRILQSAPGCRIINVSSKVHRYGDIHFDNLNPEKSFYTPLKAYAQSKLANILFTRELDRRLKEAGITGVNVYSLHPGVINTELGRHFNKSVFPGARNLFNFFSRLIKTPEQGAQTTIHCAVDEEAGRESGLYYEDCRVANPSEKARDIESGKRLWDESCKLVGLPIQESIKDLLHEV